MMMRRFEDRASGVGYREGGGVWSGRGMDRAGIHFVYERVVIVLG